MINKNIRGVADIRTMAGRYDPKRPHTLYSRLTVLTLQKANRIKERENELHRLQRINNRVKAIEDEEAELLQLIYRITNGRGVDLEKIKSDIEKKTQSDIDKKRCFI